MLTAKLNNGMTALAKKTRYGVGARTYANRTQAVRACEKIKAEGVASFVWQSWLSRVFYVVIGDVAANI